ncbi:hypothetical protein D3C78_661730 [compost metagenome]
MAIHEASALIRNIQPYRSTILLQPDSPCKPLTLQLVAQSSNCTGCKIQFLAQVTKPLSTVSNQLVQHQQCRQAHTFNLHLVSFFNKSSNHSSEQPIGLLQLIPACIAACDNPSPPKFPSNIVPATFLISTFFIQCYRLGMFIQCTCVKRMFVRFTFDSRSVHVRFTFGSRTFNAYSFNDKRLP